MKYLKSGQMVPGKGMAYMLYEIEGADSIKRMLTHIPDAGEIKLYDKPRMKTLFQPERLDEITPEEFEYIWDMGKEAGQ